MTELRHGVVDIGLITPIYVRGGAHLIRTQAGYYGGVTTFAQQVALYRCLESSDTQFASELHGLVVLAVQGGNLPGIVTRNKQVTSLADLKGLRLRAPSELLSVLKFLGADPVDMPMGDVYSALAKGVLDGVIAPADTLKSLHFAEVAHYFNTITIPRGAYPGRAMGMQRWNALTREQQALLRESGAVWEQALDDELSKAEHAGVTAGHERHMQFTDFPPDQFQHFLDIYNRFAERGAEQLQGFGIDGMTPFRLARRIAADAASTHSISCTGEH